MIERVVGTLREHPELGLFLVLALGHLLGRLPLGTFRPGPVLGTLIAGLAVGQLGIPVSDPLKNVFFLLFVFAVGFRTGPEFFRALRASAIPQVALTGAFCVAALASTSSLAGFFGFDAGISAGLLAGAMTSSTALGSATSAAAGLGLTPASSARLAQDVAAAYALAYVPGVVLSVGVLPHLGPWLMHVNLRDISRELERALGMGPNASAVNAAHRRIVVRAYRLPAALDGQTIADVERGWPPDDRVVVVGVRRRGGVLDAVPGMALQAGDTLAVAGRSGALASDANPLGDEEVDDRSLVEVPAISADLVLTNRNLAGRSLRAIAQQVGARGIFLIALRRAGRELPFVPSTIVERGDMLTVSGTPAEIARVAGDVGFAEYPTTSTDLLLLSATIFIGALIGLPAVIVGPMTLSLTMPVGVLLAGFTLGHLRSIHPRFGRIPEASIRLFESLGLAVFLALVGLQAGPGAVAAFKTAGLALIASAALVALVPLVVTILAGHYLFGMHPAILLGLCAGAATSGAALAALERAADSKVPSLGYGLAYALGSVVTAAWGTLIVLTSAG